MKDCLGERKVMSWMLEMKKVIAECGGEYDEYLVLFPFYFKVLLGEIFLLICLLVQ